VTPLERRPTLVDIVRRKRALRKSRSCRAIAGFLSLSLVLLDCPSIASAEEVSADSPSVARLNKATLESAVRLYLASNAGEVDQLSQLSGPSQRPGPGIPAKRPAVFAQQVQRIADSTSIGGPSALAGCGLLAAIVGGIFWASSGKSDKNLYQGYQPSCDENISPATCDNLKKTGKWMFVGGGAALAAAIPMISRHDKGIKVVSRGSGTQSSLAIVNRTGYPLRVQLEGPDQKTATLGTGESQTVTLAPGQYTETIEAVGKEAETYHSLQTFERGASYRLTLHTRR
jgi:hypothetical protein